jgi:O-antigen/teichoic acid export membrane protein
VILRRALGSGALIGAGQIISQGLSLVRNVVVARLVSPADFGIASTLVLTVSLIEMVSDLNTGVLLVQAPDGDDAALQGTAHSLNLLRAAISGAALLAAAWPASVAFGIPEARWAFQWLALYPLLRGAAHLDAIRFQRQMRFGASVSAEVAGQLAAVIVAWPLTAWRRDYSALLWLLLIQRAIATAFTFVVCERRFQLAWEIGQVRRVLKFGWPLLLNGLIIFATMQGDRLVIGASPRLFSAANYTLSDLGVFAAAAGLIVMSSTVLTKITLSLMLPVLSEVQSAPSRFRTRYVAFAQILGLAAAILGSGFVVAGNALVSAIYGHKYAAPYAVIVWLSATQAVRIIRMGPTVAALALGDTHNALIANCVRASGFVLALILASVGAHLGWLAAAGVVGELLALSASLVRLRREHALPMKLTLKPIWLTLGGTAAACIIMRIGADRFGWLGNGVTVATLSLFVVSGWFALLPPEVRNVVREHRAGFGVALQR